MNISLLLIILSGLLGLLVSGIKTKLLKYFLENSEKVIIDVSKHILSLYSLLRFEKRSFS